MSNWIYRNAADTTVVRCTNDSLTRLSIRPNAMTMMMPSPLYITIDLMRMDSLLFPHDSTVIGWCRILAGSDSLHYTMMNGSMMGGSLNMMQFMMAMRGQFHWDSLMTDSVHRHWHLTGMKGWNGTAWMTIPTPSIQGNTAVFFNSQLYSAVAFVGTPAGATAVKGASSLPTVFALGQNYPNPFNPSTTIDYSIPKRSKITVEIFNTLGQAVARITPGEQDAGIHAVQWNAAAPTDIYFYRFEAVPVDDPSQPYVKVMKMLLLK